jgi:hypothetical protein
MEGTITINSVRPTRGNPLSETIAKFRSEFSNMKNELHDMRSKNAALEEKLAEWRSQYVAMSESDLPSLRRQVAYYCHPDRNGDASLMSRLNTLFDFLTSMGHSKDLCYEDARKGEVI